MFPTSVSNITHRSHFSATFKSHLRSQSSCYRVHHLHHPYAHTVRHRTHRRSASRLFASQLISGAASWSFFVSASLPLFPAGLVTRQFEPADSYGEGLRRVLLTSAATGPLWLVVESALQVPASYDTSLAHYSSSLFGLAATMALVRTVR